MDEYISRKRTLEQIHAVGGTGAAPDTWADGYDKGVDVAYGIVKALPAADVRPVVYGEWESIKEEMYSWLRGREDVITGYKCSVCGRRERFEEPFCNCGADMRGGPHES